MAPSFRVDSEATRRLPVGIPKAGSARRIKEFSASLVRLRGDYVGKREPRHPSKRQTQPRKGNLIEAAGDRAGRLVVIDHQGPGITLAYHPCQRQHIDLPRQVCNCLMAGIVKMQVWNPCIFNCSTP